MSRATQRSDFYTGTGDRGDTGRLRGKVRVSKNSALMEAVGTVDEAMSAIGLARTQCCIERLKDALPTIQRHLYRLLSHLSAVPEARDQYPGLTPGDVTWLEELIAEIEGPLPPLKEFVLPGDSLSGAAFHVARAIVRRAERRLVAFAELEPDLGRPNLIYLNRLSSLLFVAALSEDLRVGRKLGTEDPDLRPPTP